MGVLPKNSAWSHSAAKHVTDVSATFATNASQSSNLAVGTYKKRFRHMFVAQISFKLQFPMPAAKAPISSFGRSSQVQKIGKNSQVS